MWWCPYVGLKDAFPCWISTVIWIFVYLFSLDALGNIITSPLRWVHCWHFREVPDWSFLSRQEVSTEFFGGKHTKMGRSADRQSPDQPLAQANQITQLKSILDLIKPIKIVLEGWIKANHEQISSLGSIFGGSGNDVDAVFSTNQILPVVVDQSANGKIRRASQS